MYSPRATISRIFVFLLDTVQGWETELYGMPSDLPSEMACHQTCRKGGADKAESQVKERMRSALRVACLAKTMVSVLVNLSLKKIVVTDLISQNVLSFRIRWLTLKKIWKFFSTTFPKDKNPRKWVDRVFFQETLGSLTFVRSCSSNSVTVK